MHMNSKAISGAGIKSYRNIVSINHIKIEKLINRYYICKINREKGRRRCEDRDKGEKEKRRKLKWQK